jgi:hypothetical protein
MEALNKKLYEFIDSTIKVISLAYNYYSKPLKTDIDSKEIYFNYRAIDIWQILEELDFITENRENLHRILIRTSELLSDEIDLIPIIKKRMINSPESETKTYFAHIIRRIETNNQKLNNYRINIFENSNTTINLSEKGIYFFDKEQNLIFSILYANYFTKQNKTIQKFQLIYQYLSSFYGFSYKADYEKYISEIQNLEFKLKTNISGITKENAFNDIKKILKANKVNPKH